MVSTGGVYRVGSTADSEDYWRHGEFATDSGIDMAFLTTDGGAFMDSDSFAWQRPQPKYEAPKRIDRALRCRYCNTAYKIPEEGVIRCPGCGAPPSEEEI